MNFKTISISPNELLLDIENPRFIVTPGAKQEDIISYLLESEDVINLCKGINSYKGLVIGERIVAYMENGKYIVGEGNRRTCACKLLLNPNLAPENWKGNIPKILNETKSNINKVQVDVAKTRDEAMASMGAKHIAGIKRWSTYAKMKYFYDQFSAGKTIQFISGITLTSTTKVIQQIKFYNLLFYSKNIEYFAPLERDTLFNFSNPDIKISIFTKALTLSYANGILKSRSLSSLLKLEYDSISYRVKSGLPKKVFDKALYIIAKNSLDPKTKFNTRSNIDDLEELENLLIDYELNPEKYNNPTINLSENRQLELPIVPNTNNLDNIETDIDHNSNFRENKDTILTTSKKPLIENKNDVNVEILDFNFNEISIDGADTLHSRIIPDDSRPTPKPHERPALPCFFSTLTWSTVDANNADNTGLISLCIEIQKISQSRNYKKYPISASILTRALFEQTLLYYLKKDELKYKSLLKKSNYKVPQLEKTIAFVKNGIDNLIQDDQLKRCFKTFADSTGNKDYFDMVIHNPHLIAADPNMLDTIANNGLRGFIHLVLNA